jgi:hypothetical protein
MAIAGVYVNLSLDNATQVGAYQAQGMKAVLVVDQHGWDFWDYQARSRRIIGFWPDLETPWRRWVRLVTQEAHQATERQNSTEANQPLDRKF